MYHMKT